MLRSTMQFLYAIGKTFNDHPAPVWVLLVVLVLAVPSVLFFSRAYYRANLSKEQTPGANIINSSGKQTINTNENSGTITQHNQ